LLLESQKDPSNQQENMASIVQHLHSTTTGNKPTTTGLESGQVAFNLADRLMFLGNGSNAFTRADGTAGTAPPTGKGFIEIGLNSGSQVYTAAAVTKVGAAPTTAEINTAIGNPTLLREGDITIITAGADAGMYFYSGSDWIIDPNARSAIANVTAVATVAAANTAAQALVTAGTLSQGDTLIITGTTGLGTQATFGGANRGAPPVGFIEGQHSIAYMYTSGNTWEIIGTPIDTQYANGNGVLFTTTNNTVSIALDYALAADLPTGSTVGTGSRVLRADARRPIQADHVNFAGGTAAVVAAASQSGVIMRDTSVTDENAVGAYKLVSILSAGTF
jgi:hypothetical protein